MRNLKTSLLGDMNNFWDNVISKNPLNWQYHSAKPFWSSFRETREPLLKGLCLIN